MLLSQFDSRFPSEDSCVDYFKDIRLQYGVICPECGEVSRKWLNGRKAFQCPKCGCSIPLTKGTVMEHSKLSLRTWFYTMHLMTSIKQVLSAKGPVPIGHRPVSSGVVDDDETAKYHG